LPLPDQFGLENILHSFLLFLRGKELKQVGGIEIPGFSFSFYKRRLEVPVRMWHERVGPGWSKRRVAGGVCWRKFPVWLRVNIYKMVPRPNRFSCTECCGVLDPEKGRGGIAAVDVNVDVERVYMHLFEGKEHCGKLEHPFS